MTSKTPPTFLFHTYDDATVPVENSVAFFSALRKAGVPAELHIYEHGPHGVGLALDDPVLSTWPKLLENWFRVRGLLPKNVFAVAGAHLLPQLSAVPSSDLKVEKAGIGEKQRAGGTRGSIC